MKSKTTDPGREIRIEKISSLDSRKGMIDRIPAEYILAIYINNEKNLESSCSPWDIKELIVGNLYNGNLIGRYSDIVVSDENKKRISVSILKSDYRIEARIKISGAKSGKKTLNKKGKDIKFNSDVLLKLNRIIRKNQETKNNIGGLHSAALFDGEGNLLKIAEDISRHNCIDKITGHILINEISTDEKIIYTSGRVNMDIIYKISKINIPVIISNSSITYNAAEMARCSGITAIAYARDGRFNIYSCPERIV